MSPKEAASDLELYEAGYWLWGLLWVGYTENNNGQVSSAWYPVGLVIGAINFFRAVHTNGDFTDDVTTNALQSGDLRAGEERGGLVFFNKRGGQKYDLVISYADSTGKNKELSMPYKL